MDNQIKSKVQQLYRFLKKATELRFAPVRTLTSQERVIRFAEMPTHPTLQVKRPIYAAGEAQERQDFELRVKRPTQTPCPVVPQPLVEWLMPGYDDPTKPISVAQSLNVVVERQFQEEPQRVLDLKTFREARRLDPQAVPPDSISRWLQEGWDQPDRMPAVHTTMTFTETVQFGDDPLRVASLETWKAIRDQWVEPELSARKAMAFYERIYDLYVTLEKDGESIELMVADGRFQWIGSSDVSDQIQIDHHVLLKRVELRFNPDVPEFVIVDTDREPELYSSMFVDLKNLLPVAIRSRTEELEKAGYHPMGFDDTTGFLRAFIQTVSPTAGLYIDSTTGEPITTTPRLYRDPALILRKRSRGIANAVNAIIEDIEGKEVFPPALGQITGADSGWSGTGLGDGGGSGIASAGGSTGGGAAILPLGISDDDILLAKEANEEQLQIIRRLDRSGSVIVQGPPGTGKTHTIGNLIGHLLAQGKSILVTAQTAKALRVVREQVPDMLRPLAVSILGSDQSARSQLENAVASITERMTSDSAESLLQKASKYEEERKALLRQKKELKNKLRQALENEYRDIAVGKKTFTPAEAARWVREQQAQHSWIPSPVKLGVDLTLSDQELTRAYALSVQFTLQEELDCGLTLPDLSQLPNETKLSVMVSEYQALLSADRTTGASRWTSEGGGSEPLAAVAAALENEFSDDLRKQAWRPHAIVAGILGGSARTVWLRLIEQIEEAFEAQAQYTLSLHHQPRISQSMLLPVQKRVVNEIVDYLGTGGKLGFLQLITRGEWKQFIKASMVSAGEPSVKEHFEALRSLIHLENARQALQPLWDQLVGAHTGIAFASLGPAPEQAGRAIIPEIRRCLDWHESTWKPIEEKLNAEGLLLADVLATIPRETSAVSDYLVVEKLATVALPPLLAAELVRRKIKECEQGFLAIEKLITVAGQSGTDAGCTGLIAAALRSRDLKAYEGALNYARRLMAAKPLVIERKALLDRLGLVAPVWSEQLASRTEPHHCEKLPGDIALAWTWRQLHDELVVRDALNANEIQLEIDKVDARLREVTQLLIDAKAWGKQLERLKQNNSIRQALVGWLDTMKLLLYTRQEDRRQTLLSEGRKLMRQCGEAVPVWVMPISIVAENFDPRTTKFDVVIIDEASQADLNALIPLYLGRQIIIVGDHEQVTPLGVGQGQAILENIRQQTLTDIPNAHLFDSKFSIYDIGRQSFGDAIRLVEHFRCVPEIIAFSNKLSYDGTIKPLRESNSSNLKPACVSVKVDGIREKDMNQLEARHIVDMIKAMVEHPLYVGKSIGVISMLGDQQTHLLQSLILKELPGREIEERRIIAGNSSEFQGDERDVILLSMVDSPEGEGPMRLSGEGAFALLKKRYNVAASRAKDQLIVVHSFDPNLHLKPGDMRLELMKHIADPMASLRAYQKEVGRTESPFERAVLKRLTDAGYKVRTQWEVGYYRIDMVVEGGGKRLAVECDGDRYHPIDKLADDIERQTILERLGWQFVRIRGSAFYRDADAAMKPVFERLLELEIPREADDDLPQAGDFTLIHELEEIIARNFQIKSTDSAFQPSDTSVTITSPNVSSQVEQEEYIFPDAKPDDSPYGLLKRMGGKAELEQFLRELAKSKGFVRLRQSVRDRMFKEIESLIESGCLMLDSGIVRITKP